MSNTSNASKNVKRFLLLFALGIAYGFMYVMPYMKSSFYDQMIAAMGCTNAQLGSLMTAYCICCTVSYLPGGWIGDKFNPKPVLLISIFGQAALSFLFMFTYKSYTMAVIIWLLMGLTGGFAFWPAIMKGIRMTGTDEEQGRMYGIFEALNGLASLLLSFIMIGVMAVVGGSDLITGFKSALAFMGGLSIVSGILVAILMPKDAAYGVNMEQVQAVLNATADKATLTPQMQRMMNRQAENTKRVEETIKGTKSNPRWFVPLFCTLMVIGLVWAVVYYLTGNYPIPNISFWNLVIAFAFIMVGFIMTMWWR